VQGAPAELVHPLIYTQNSVRRLTTLFSSHAPAYVENVDVDWVAARQRTATFLPSINPTAETNQGGPKLQDESMVEELIENLYQAARRGEVPQFFLRSILRFRHSEMQRRIDEPSHRAESASGGMASSRAAARLRAHSRRAERVLR
jgi:hypothetical protein